jgi:hypothetical protein
MLRLSQPEAIAMLIRRTILVFFFLGAASTSQASNIDLEQRMLQMEQRLNALESTLLAKDQRIEQQQQKIVALETGTLTEQAVPGRELTEEEKQALVTLANIEPILYQAQEKIGYHYGRPDRYIPIPGTDTSLDIGGHIWNDIIYNDREMANKAGFQPSSIPTVNQRRSNESTFSAGQSKIYFKTFTPTQWGEMHTRIEYDMWQDDGSSDFNVTHLWAELGSFGAGQTFSNFMDITTFPNIIEYWGPNSMVFARQAQVRYTHKLSEQTEIAISLEDPSSDVTLPDGAPADGREELPDLALSYFTEHDWGHFRVAALLREISAEANDGSERSEEDLGWGLNFTGSLNFGERDRLVYQYAFGEGFARYMNDPCCSTVGGNDAALNKDGDLEAIEIAGGFVYWDHFWSKRWSSSIGASYAEIDPLAGQINQAYDHGFYTSANLLWYPADPLKIGFELVYGEVEDKAGRSSQNTRYVSSVAFKF